jgi:hypothetical protein
MGQVILTNNDIRVRAGISRAAMARFLEMTEPGLYRMELRNRIAHTKKGRKYEAALKIMENHGMVNYVPCPTVVLLKEKKMHRRAAS